MIKKFVSKYGFKLAALALVIGQVSASIPCRGDLYQPKVLQELLK